MRVIHTGDWHLGKKLFKHSRFDEHEAFLAWLKELLQKESTDLLLICGDIFDVPNPPHSSLRQFYSFLEDIQRTTSTHIVCLAGNHDSAQLIEAASPLVSPERISLRGQLFSSTSEEEFPHRKNFLNLTTPNGKWAVCALPYFRVHELHSVLKTLRPEMEMENLHDEDIPLKALEAFFADFHQWAYDLEQKEEISRPRLLTAHHLFGSFRPAGSEQGLSLSGLESLPLSLVENFDYVALGHIHRPQCLKKAHPEVQYAGSPLPLRFSEANETGKRLLRVDFNETDWRAPPESQSVSIPSFRHFLRAEGSIDAERIGDVANFLTTPLGEKLASQLENLKKKEDLSLPAFLEIKAWPDSPCPGLADTLRDYLDQFQETNGIKVELLSLLTLFESDQRGPDKETVDDIHYLRPEKLLEKYYKQKYPAGELSEDIRSEFRELLQRIENPPTEEKAQSSVTNFQDPQPGDRL